MTHRICKTLSFAKHPTYIWPTYTFKHWDFGALSVSRCLLALLGILPMYQITQDLLKTGLNLQGLKAAWRVSLQAQQWIQELNLEVYSTRFSYQLHHWLIISPLLVHPSWVRTFRGRWSPPMSSTVQLWYQGIGVIQIKMEICTITL